MLFIHIKMYEYNAKLIRVIDGDTIDCYLDLGFNIILKERVRLKGIDTPETRTKDLDEKVKGLAAKKRVEDLFIGVDKFVITTEIRKGKYGRILGTIILPEHELSLNEILLHEGHAKVYV